MDLERTLARVDRIDTHYANVTFAPAPSDPDAPSRAEPRFVYGDTPTWAFLT